MPAKLGLLRPIDGQLQVRLGRRQLDVLRAAANNQSHAWHSSQGSYMVSGLEDAHPMDVLESLLDRGLIKPEREDTVNGYRVALTDTGWEALRDLP